MRSFNPHDKELIGKSVRKFYEAEGYFKASYQRMNTAYECMESRRIPVDYIQLYYRRNKNKNNSQSIYFFDQFSVSARETMRYGLFVQRATQLLGTIVKSEQYSGELEDDVRYQVSFFSFFFHYYYYGQY